MEVNIKAGKVKMLKKMMNESVWGYTYDYRGNRMSMSVEGEGVTDYTVENN